MPSFTNFVSQFKQWAKELKRETFALYLAYKDPRTPWYARLWAALVVAYAFSPIDLIPDPIPVLGYLDDLILVPLGIALAIRLIPPIVLTEARAEADKMLDHPRPGHWLTVWVIIVIWFLTGVVLFQLLRQIWV